MTTAAQGRNARRSARRRSQRGNVALIVAITVVMLCGFAALAVDAGNMYRVRSQSRAALDAAALAAAGALNGTALGITRARERAVETAAQHRVNRSNLQLPAAEIEFGQWLNNAFTLGGATNVTNAVRITHRTEPIAHPFGAVMGRRSTPIGALATAVGGGPNVTCAFPMAVADCNADPSATGQCDMCGVMRVDNTDTIGWTSFTGNANPNQVEAAVRASCFANGAPSVDANGVCNAQCTNVPTTPIPLNNGNNFNQNNGPCSLIQQILRRNGTIQPFRAIVPVIDGGGGTPCNPRFNGSASIRGFTQVTIYGARCSNSDNSNTFVSPLPATCPPNLPSEKYVVMQMDCNARSNSLGTGRFFGLTGRPRLVQ